jgi:hypothetical protein
VGVFLWAMYPCNLSLFAEIHRPERARAQEGMGPGSQELIWDAAGPHVGFTPILPFIASPHPSTPPLAIEAPIATPEHSPAYPQAGVGCRQVRIFVFGC